MLTEGVRARVSKRRKLESAFESEPAKIIEVKDGNPSLFLLSFIDSGVRLKPNGKRRYFTSQRLCRSQMKSPFEDEV